jgi:hypothetical protein
MRPSRNNPVKAKNLLVDTWSDIDSGELRVLLDARIGGPGQYDGRAQNPDKFYLPLGRSSCQIALLFRGNKIVAIERGPAFDPIKWEQISEEIEKTVLTESLGVGREYSFSSYQVHGYWRGGSFRTPDSSTAEQCAARSGRDGRAPLHP